MTRAWPRVALGEALSKSEGWINIAPTETYREVTVRLWGRGVTLRREVLGGEIKADRRLRVRAGQFILSRIDARNGASGLIPAELDGAVVSNDFPVFDVRSERLSPGFLGWLARTRGFVELCRAASEGTTNRVRLKEDRFLRMEIPLPPLAEQRRIVAKIDQLAAKIAEARESRRWSQRDLEALAASGANHVCDRLRGVATVVAMGDIADIRSGVTLGRDLRGSTITLPYLRVANVQDGHLDLAVVKTVSVLTSESDKWRLEVGDVLLTEGGDWDKLGRGTVWRDEIPGCIHQNHIFRVRVDQDRFDPRYVAALTSSPYGRTYFAGASKQTTNLASINQRQLKAFPVFDIQIVEQRRIVAYLDDLQAKVDRLKALQAQTAAELDALLPAILDRAFKGEL